MRHNVGIRIVADCEKKAIQLLQFTNVAQALNYHRSGYYFYTLLAFRFLLVINLKSILYEQFKRIIKTDLRRQ